MNPPCWASETAVSLNLIVPPNERNPQARRALPLHEVLLLSMAHVARQASSLPMTRRPMCIAVTVAALSLAVLSSACSQEQISEQPALLRSAEQGDVAAQFDLGDRYFNGEGVPQDHGEALRWYRLAADQGLAEAQTLIGAMYANGRGVPQDVSEAVHWGGGSQWLNSLATSSHSGP